MVVARAKIITQRPRDYTVQVRAAGTEQIVGTGVAVSMHGDIVTCRHVAEKAGWNAQTSPEIKIGVYFPQAMRDEDKKRTAVVAAYFEDYDDDIVMLKLEGKPPPLQKKQIAKLGAAEDSVNHEFIGYGFCQLGNYKAARSRGMIDGPVPPPEGRNMATEPVQLTSSAIGQGMSGSGVLDVKPSSENHNLVVALVTHKYNPLLQHIFPEAAWAVDMKALTLPPFNLTLHEGPLPLYEAPVLRIDVEAMKAKAVGRGEEWHNAPPPLGDEWAGRVELLAGMDEDWDDAGVRVTELEGFGGEGKSSVARKWVDELLADSARPSPDGVFWWGFYQAKSADLFFESALDFMGGGKIDQRGMSAGQKASMIAGMLGAGRFIFVLDGFEVMQEQGGDRHGLIQSRDLKNFLEHFADPWHNSHCVITTRTRLLDIADYKTVKHRDVERMGKVEGRKLLRNVGVKGEDVELDKVVQDWDGHALTLSLLGSYLRDDCDGDVTCVSEIPAPTSGEDRYERVARVLRRYDEYIEKQGAAYLDFLTIFSAFRLPVKGNALNAVFRADLEPDAINASISAMDDEDFTTMLDRLLSYRLIRHDPDKDQDKDKDQYTNHPLIQKHYEKKLAEKDKEERDRLHKKIGEYYLEEGGGKKQWPDLDDLKPFIETVHHSCEAGDYDGAIIIWQDRLYQGDRRVIASGLGAYEIVLSVLSEFFPEGNTTKEPLVSSKKNKGFLLNGTGVALTALGYLDKSTSFFSRANAITKELKDWKNASICYQNLAEKNAHLGELSKSLDASRESITLARKSKNKMIEGNAFAYEAYALHLLGDLDRASESFQRSEALERKINPQVKYRYSLSGIRHSDHLRRIGEYYYSSRVAEENLKICERNRLANDLSRCLRVLGDLDADVGNDASARVRYNDAVRIARGISQRDVLIDALLSRGRFEAPLADHGFGFSDLNEALDYALADGYRIYEADARISLARAHLSSGDPASARSEAELALSMSEDMSYHWGKLDAAAVLSDMECGDPAPL